MYNVTTHKISLSLEFGHLDRALNWCEENCIGVWHLGRIEVMAGSDPAVYDFLFEDERDLIRFELRWK